jgi:NAD(P)-dependent dehydrogenase (short-subunit alcohol dehydrogenase family)
LAREVGDREDEVHILVNNAGTNWAEDIATYPVEGFDKVMALNVRAVFHVTQQFLPLLRAAARPEDPSRVITIGSIDGIRVPLVESFAYSSSKAAVHMLTRHLSGRLVAEHITCNAIAPGLFKTKMTKVFYQDDATVEFVQGGIPMKRDGRPEEIAGTTIWLASKAASYVTGAVIPVDGGVATLGHGYA